MIHATDAAPFVADAGRNTRAKYGNNRDGLVGKVELAWTNFDRITVELAIKVMLCGDRLFLHEFELKLKLRRVKIEHELIKK
jgi:hypothetical protein